MKSILILIDEIPWVMAPATLIAATLVITLVSVFIRHTEWLLKFVILAIMLALTAGATIFSGVI
jgi:uncharacterized membrane protein